MALILAALINRSAIGHTLQRTFLSMMVHEAGHAVTSWFCGFAAFPALWVTRFRCARHRARASQPRRERSALAKGEK